MGLKKKRVFLIIGAPGSGKTSISSALVDSNLMHFSIGKMYREIAKEPSLLGVMIKKYIDFGKIVPLDIAKDVISNFLETDCQTIVFDGFPRDIEQAEMFDELLDNPELELVRLIEILVDKQIAIERIIQRKRGFDDREELFNDRFALYENERSKIINFYIDKNKYTSVDGNLSFDAVVGNLKKLMLGFP